MDIDTIPPGEKFDQYIKESLTGCYLCIAVIGRRWSLERLRDESDFVRKEIAVALASGVRVVPVLFDGAKLPLASELPPELSDLTLCQASDFGAGHDFKGQVKQLLADVERAIKEAAKREAERSEAANRSVALKPHQYPIWVLFICSAITLSASASLIFTPLQARALASLWLGEAAAARGERAQAIALFRKALDKEPSSQNARIELIVALFSSKSPDDTVEAPGLLAGATNIDSAEWNRIKSVIPAEDQHFFKDVKP